jgi:hypothetical protein
VLLIGACLPFISRVSSISWRGFGEGVGRSGDSAGRTTHPAIRALGHCVVSKAGCNWYLLDINIYFLSKK